MNPRKDDVFFLDTEEGSQECKIITTIYSESRKKYYVIYEYVNNKGDEIFASSYDPSDEDGILYDITDEKELKEIETFLKEYEDEKWYQKK